MKIFSDKEDENLYIKYLDSIYSEIDITLKIPVSILPDCSNKLPEIPFTNYNLNLVKLQTISFLLYSLNRIGNDVVEFEISKRAPSEENLFNKCILTLRSEGAIVNLETKFYEFKVFSSYPSEEEEVIEEVQDETISIFVNTNSLNILLKSIIEANLYNQTKSLIIISIPEDYNISRNVYIIISIINLNKLFTPKDGFKLNVYDKGTAVNENKEFELMKLPYNMDELDPDISKETVEYHYLKHHQGYVNKLNELGKTHRYVFNYTLEELIKMEPKNNSIYNLACQIWNHDFYWLGLDPKGSGRPTLAVEQIINDSFESFSNFKKEFTETAMKHFGSGWVWLLYYKHKPHLRIVDTHDADNPMKLFNTYPLLVLDVWEHAYYIDHRNDRKSYIDKWFNKINWNRVENLLEHNLKNETALYTIDERPLSFYITFKPGVKCLELSYANKPVWTYYDNQETKLYPTELYFQRYEKRITVNFRTMYLEYEYYNGKWNLESNVVMNHVVKTGLTIVTADDEQGTNAKTNDTTKYRVSTHDYVVEYVFNEGAYCTEVRLQNQKVWKYEPGEAQKGFPKALYFHSDLGLIFADFQGLSSLFKCSQQGCKCISNHKTNGISLSNLKIVTQDPNNVNNQKENDTTQFVRKDEGYGHLFQMNKSARCTEVRYKNKTLWNHGYKSGDEYPEALFFNSYFRMIVLKFSGFQLIFMGLDKWRYITKPDLDPLSESDISLYTRDENSHLIENDKTQYEVVKYPYNMALLYNFEPGSRCEQLSFKGRTVWKRNQARLGNNYPTTIYVNRNMQLIMISGEKFFYVYGNLDKWREVFRTVDKGVQRGGFDKANLGDAGSLENYHYELDNKSDVSDLSSENSFSHSQHSDDSSDTDSDSGSDDSEDDDDDDEDARSDISEEESVFSSRGAKPSRRRHPHHHQMSESYMQERPTNRPSRQSLRREPPTPKQLYRLPNEKDDDDDEDDDDDDDEDGKPQKAKTPDKNNKTKSGGQTALMVSIMLLLLAAVVGGVATTFIMVKRRRSRMLLENQVSMV
nr:hypothetical protein MACL_00002733 [Theileria orientalis]